MKQDNKYIVDIERFIIELRRYQQYCRECVTRRKLR